MTTTLTRVAKDPRVWSFGQQGLVLGGGFFSGIVLARGLGVVGRGEYAQTQVLYALATPVLSLGVPLALLSQMYVFPRARVVGGHLAISTGLVAAAILLIFPAPVSWLCAALVIGPVTASWAEAALVRSGRAIGVQPLRTADVFGSSLLVVAFYVCGVLSVETAVVALFAPTVILRLAVYFWRSPNVPSGALSVHPLYSTALRKFYPRELLSVSAGYSDLLAASLILPAASLGIYAAASSVGRLALAPYSALYGEAIRFAARPAWTPKELARRLLLLPGVSNIALVVVFLLFGVSIITGLFGTEYADAAPLVTLLLVSFSLGGLASLFETVLTVSFPRSVSWVPRFLSIVPAVGLWVLAYSVDRSSFLLVVGVLVQNAVVLAGTACLLFTARGIESTNTDLGDV